MSRIVEVQPYHGHMPYAPCAGGCGRISTRDFTPVYADLDGPAFQAYYCRGCIDWAEQKKPTDPAPVAR